MKPEKIEVAGGTFSYRRDLNLIPTASPFDGGQAWVERKRKLIVLRTMELGRVHLSVSSQDRDPTWAELKEIRYRLASHDITMVMVLPPPAEYVNVHEHCFQMHELPPEPKE